MPYLDPPDWTSDNELRNLEQGRSEIMALRFLGKVTQSGNSPTLWAEEHDYVVQGFTLDPETLAEVGRIPEGEAVIRVPKKLMAYLVKDIDGATSV
jgi:hypothetical protein